MESTRPRDAASIRPVTQRSYWKRVAVVAGLAAAIGLVLAWMGLRLGAAPMVAFGAVVAGAWPAYIYWEDRRTAAVLDRDGVTRRDGIRFAWSNLRGVERVHVIHKWGQGALNHLILRFGEGQVRVFPHTLENGWEIMKFIDEVTAPKPEPPPDQARPRREDCRICSRLSAFHRGFQKHGREEEDTFLPPECAELTGVHDLTSRKSVVQCPVCGTYYLHEIEYEYLATGSEDEQSLTRLSEEEARGYLAQPGRKR